MSTYIVSSPFQSCGGFGSLASRSSSQNLGLTRREQQLVQLLSEGLTNKEIAATFNLAEQTVKNTFAGRCARWAPRIAWRR
jgi:DNA-binding NarL/FixJ family response regulator